jgi:hypothetical protein
VKLTLSISIREVARIRAFFETHRHDPFVRLRIGRPALGDWLWAGRSKETLYWT